MDSPEITRCVMNYKRLQMTDLTVEIEREPKKAALKAALEKAGAQLLLPPCASARVSWCLRLLRTRHWRRGAIF